MLTGVVEEESFSGNEFAYNVRHQHLATCRLAGNMGGCNDTGAKEIVFIHYGLTGIHTNSYLQWFSPHWFAPNAFTSVAGGT